MSKHYAMAEVKALGDESEGNGEFEAILNAPSLDRDGEIIDAKAFDPLPPSIPILADHRGEVRSLVARAVPFYDGDVLKVRGKFASHEFAQFVRGLVLEGMLDTMSVGFMSPVKSMKNGVPHITKGEVLEGSFVPIPSNRDALIQAAKSFDGVEVEEQMVIENLADPAFDGIAKAGRRNSAKDQAVLDAAHDALVAAGASCSHKADDEEDDEEPAKDRPVTSAANERVKLEGEIDEAKSFDLSDIEADLVGLDLDRMG